MHTLPIVGAPMAGGPTTPELVAAVSNAGGFGMLAAGYLTADALATQIAAVRELTDRPFGVNVFAREAVAPDRDGAAAFRERLLPLGERLGVSIPELAGDSDDDYAAKINLLVTQPVALVTFTFGLPGFEDARALRAAGSEVGVTVTNVEDARAALELPCDVLVVQGPDAGGHRSTFDQSATPGTASLDELVREIAALTETVTGTGLPAAAASLPERAAKVRIIAAGGISTPERAAEVLAVGADAVALGTLLLTADEAGTRPLHRAALLAGERDTVVTRAFSGRSARALRNTFSNEFTPDAPAAYPLVHFLTKPVRAASPDAEFLNLWAGTGYRACRAEPVAAILARFADLAQA